MSEEELRLVREEIWELLENGESDAAVVRALRAVNDYEDDAELRYLLGVGLMDLDEIEAALPELERAAEVAAVWPEARAALAWAYFRACRFEDAAKTVAQALELNAEMPDVHQLRGLLAERAERDDEALLAFAEARRLDPEAYPDPYTMTESEFNDIARAAVEELDERTRAVLEEAALFIQPFPAEVLLRESDPPLDPQLLGLFVGFSLLEQSVQDSGQLPNTMYLFQRNLERIVTSRDELVHEIRVTVLHEIGHHFGWSDAELEAKGFG